MAILKSIAVKGGVADVYVEGVIGAKDGTTAASFREQLTAARAAGARELCVHFNSPGGSVTQGMAIFNTLRAWSGRKVGIVEGIAASMGSVILMACDTIRVAKGGFVMIHNPSIDPDGPLESRELRKAADEMDQMRDELLDIYETRTGIDRKQLEKMLDTETYFSAEEAVEAGVADEIDAFEARVSLQAVARLNPEKVPAALRALAQTKGKRKMALSVKQKAEKEALEAKLAQLKAEEEKEDSGEETEEETEGSEEEPHNEDDDEETAEGDDDKSASAALVAMCLSLTGTKSASAAQGALAAIVSRGTESAKRSRAELVSAAIKAGKLEPALKSWALKAKDSAFNAYLKASGFKLGSKHKRPETPDQTASDEPTAAERVIMNQMGIKDVKILRTPVRGEKGAL